MAWCPFADDSVRGNSPGSYTGGPYRVVHHTTEGSSAEGAFGAYRNNNTWPHFTVDQETIYQHISTSVSASAVLNESGGVQTNKQSAVQIEVVGFAGSEKSTRTLENVARLCRWLEEEHGIPSVWPNGPPKYGSYDPGGHNRSSSNWTSKGGHYGHSQVPENTHWDPSYWPDEFDLVMGGVVDPIRVRINDVDQTGAVKAWLHDANSVMDVSDWCSFSRTPVPAFDNSTKDEEYAGTLDFWTWKTACQVTTSEGTCGAPAVGLVAIPLPGLPGATVLQSLCGPHRDLVTTQPIPTRRR